MDTTPTEIMIDFCLSGIEIDFDVLTSSLGVRPTSTSTMEDCIVKEYAKDSWNLSTGYQEARDIALPFGHLINELYGKEEIINDLALKYNLECLFIIVIKAEEGDGPEVILTRNCIEFASKVNAEIHFDLYYN